MNNLLRFLAIIGLSLAVNACGSSGDSRPSLSRSSGVQTDDGQPVDEQDRGLRVPHMGDRDPVRVAILLPLTHPQQNIQTVGRSLLNAAQLALFEIRNGDVLIIPKDTHGSASGAEQAAREAVAEGADIILGPLFAGSVRAAGAVARENNVPMIAFSTDRTVAGDGVYLLSFLPEQEVRRVTEFAMGEGLYAFAALVPMSAYGDRVRVAFHHTVTKSGGMVTQMQPYPRNAEEMFAPARIVAEYDDRKANLKRRKNNGPAEQSQSTMVFDPETGELVAETPDEFANLPANRETWGGVSYQAVLLPEGGTMLRSLAPLLPYFDVDPREIKFLGTGLWDDPTLGKEPSLVGGWFAAPAPQMRVAFSDRYKVAFSANPPRIASLSFDAVALVASLARLPEDRRFSKATLSNPNGFAGIDGIFRFLPDGSAERGLAVIQVTREGLEVISPAPTTFQKYQPLPEVTPQAEADDTTDLEGLGY